MDDLAGRIANAFGGRLVIDREMGGGGMSRVFLATESRIGRRVVIKVLLPELSADVSAERFRREIEIAARLQHPHVVPLLEVGEGDGIVCYSMPYVEGESLRARLERERALPVSDAVRLWREMLDALSYAHAHGVVHRDIKPENVLLSGKHAMVTDFGVAKALGQATAGDRITGTGVSLGTPAYMSPEQAAGDGQLDHRSDLYSAGLVMWEMLAGHHPFAGLAPHQMLSAQAVRWVPSVIDERPALAGPLATLVAQCLAKNPADRPTSADAVLAALEAIPITDPGRTIDAPAQPARTPDKTSRRSRRARALTALGAVVIIGYLGLRAVSRASPPLSRTASTALRPEEATADSIARRADAVFRMVAVLTTPAEASDTALRYNAQEIVGSILRADSMLMVPSRRQLTAFMRNARIPERFINDPDTLDAVVQASAHAIVRVGLARFGSSFDVSASVTRTDLRSEVARFTAGAPDSASLPRLLRIVADSARMAIRRVAPELQITGDGRFASPTSVRLLSDASQRNSARDYLGAVELARAATRADSNNVDAWRALGQYLENARMNRAEMLDAQARAYRLKSRTTEMNEAVITRDYFARTEQLDLAVAAVDSLNALANRWSIPRIPGAENSAGLVRMRQQEFALAERHYRQAIEASRTQRPWFAHSNLVAVLLAQGKRDAADSLIRIIEVRDSTGIFRRRVREFRAMMSHDYDVVITLSRADVADTNRPEFLRAFSLFRLGAALALTGRQRSADSAAGAGEELIARLGDPGLAFRSAVTRAVQLLVLTGDSATAHRIVSEAERRYAPASLRFLDRRHAQHARALAALGDTAGAARILSQWQREVPREFSRVDARAVMNARGQLALAERRPNEALSLFRNREFGFCECDQVNVARAFDALRQADSAIVYYEKYLGTPASDDLGLDLQWRPFVFRRLGELYEQQGQRTKALDSYESFVALWKNAEPEQQRVVTEVKERIAQLRHATG